MMDVKRALATQHRGRQAYPCRQVACAADSRHHIEDRVQPSPSAPRIEVLRSDRQCRAGQLKLLDQPINAGGTKNLHVALQLVSVEPLYRPHMKLLTYQ